MLGSNFSSTVSSKIALKSFSPTVASHRWLLCIFFSLTRLSRVNSKSLYYRRYQELK